MTLPEKWEKYTEVERRMWWRENVIKPRLLEDRNRMKKMPKFVEPIQEKRRLLQQKPISMQLLEIKSVFRRRLVER